MSTIAADDAPILTHYGIGTHHFGDLRGVGVDGPLGLAQVGTVLLPPGQGLGVQVEGGGMAQGHLVIPLGGAGGNVDLDAGRGGARAALLHVGTDTG